MKLTPKQKAFVDEYLISGNITEAAEHGQGLIVRQSGKKLIRGTEGQVNRMSDDLISRKAVHEVFMNWYRVVKNDCDLEWNGAVDKLASLLMEQPPAFDKEKVIE